MDLIRALFGKAYVPEEVRAELNNGRESGVDLPVVEDCRFLEVLPPQATMFSKLARDLGKGETAVILNGLECPGCLVILDDFLARNVARELGLKVSGTAGIIINAKKSGLLASVSAVLGMMGNLGFYLAPEHKSIILREAGEM